MPIIHFNLHSSSSNHPFKARRENELLRARAAMPLIPDLEHKHDADMRECERLRATTATLQVCMLTSHPFTTCLAAPQLL